MKKNIRKNKKIPKKKNIVIFKPVFGDRINALKKSYKTKEKHAPQNQQIHEEHEAENDNVIQKEDEVETVVAEYEEEMKGKDGIQTNNKQQ